jgi:glycosyltransferase involved in cell wall biosynthesis
MPLKLAGVPLLLDLHEDMPEFYRDRFRRRPLPALMPLVTGVTKASAAVADRLITVHEPLRALSVARGVRPERISVVMNSADERIFDPSRYPRRPFMADGELRIIHHSNLQRIYGMQIALEAIALLDKEIPLRVDVYGDGPYRGELEAAIERTGTADRVHLHGRVAIEELPRLIADADVGIVPSLDEPYLKYSLSTKLLEYVAMGIPVIASDLATFRAHFTDGALLYVQGGDAASLADGIRSVVADPDAAAARAREAMVQAGRYAWAGQRRSYLDVVEQMLASR